MVSMFRFITVSGFAAALCFAQPTPPTPPVPPELHFMVSINGRSYLGVNVKEIDSRRSKELGLSDEHGVEVTQVEDNSPAAKAGLKVGDVVLDYNGQRIEGTEQFVRIVRETPNGRQVKLNVHRQGSTMAMTATVAPRQLKTISGDTLRVSQEARKTAEKAREKAREQIEKAKEQFERFQFDTPRAYMGWNNAPLGVEAESVTDQLASFFGVKEGVLVRSVKKDSAAEKAGIKAGDVIVKVDGSKVATPREISSQLRAVKEKKTLSVQLVRERKDVSVEVGLPEPQPARAVPPRARTIRVSPATPKAEQDSEVQF